MTTTALDRRGPFIDGCWREGGNDEEIPVVNPATEEVISSFRAASCVDVDDAVRSSRNALEGWRRTPARERGRILWNVGQRLRERASELAVIETRQNGKPITESRFVDVPVAADCFQYYAGWADKVCGQTIPVTGPYLTYTLREPVGVIAAIVPWNFPLLLTAAKVAPALACGNTVIVKPATQTPLTAFALADIAAECGLPPGVLNVVPGRGSVIGDALVRHAGIDKIAFTGDTRTGRDIMRAGAAAVKRLTLELGGKSPNIVCADADLSAAVQGVMAGIFYGKGEICAAGSRLLVDRRIKDQFIGMILDRTRRLRLGDPLNPTTRVGPLVSRHQLDNVLGYIAAGCREGAALRAGGTRADIGTGKGFYVHPTVFDEVTPSMTIAREEIFGPVLACMEFDSIEEAIEKANQSDYGLAAAVWTRDIRAAHWIAQRVVAGTVWINTYNVHDSAAPFGGYKQSGFGREMGHAAIDHYSESKTVWVDMNMR